MIPEIQRPSSTITAAALAGMGMTTFFELVAQVGYELRPSLVAASTAFVSALIGYLKRETVLPLDRRDEHDPTP